MKNKHLVPLGDMIAIQSAQIDPNEFLSPLEMPLTFRGRRIRFFKDADAALLEEMINEPQPKHVLPRPPIKTLLTAKQPKRAKNPSPNRPQ